MKKIIIATALLIGLAFAASAQPRAIGLRLGYGTEASYQHTLNGENFIEANLGAFGFGALQASAVYNFMIAQPAWTARGEWGIYAGPGVALGTGFSKGYALNIDVVGQVGLEYTFWFPLQLSVDLRPQFGVFIAENTRFHSEGAWGGVIPTLSVRYRF